MDVSVCLKNGCSRRVCSLVRNTGAPGGARTHNLLIRSQALYPLSYGGVFRIIHEIAGVLMVRARRPG